MANLSGDCGKGLIVLDWGTTNVRLALLDNHGVVVEERRGESGVGSFTQAEFEAHFDRLTDGWPKVPAIAAGMVGSRQGWQEAAYLPCPASTGDLADGLRRFTHNGREILIVPGLALNNGNRFDVMRGEESQIAGFLNQNPNYAGVLLMPGTHSKWVQIEGARIVNFQTYMTGEVFEAISKHTILRHSLSDDSTAGNDEGKTVFKNKVQELASNPTSSEGNLFGLRARHLLEGCKTEHLRQELSAILIMAELKAGRADGFELNDDISLIGSSDLTGLYNIAFAALGKRATCLRGTGLVWPALYAIACQSNLITGTAA
ncbi:MAG: 2-dehydro-3-deoxygalactonokinase [Rhizobiaceae bacterium]